MGASPDSEEKAQRILDAARTILAEKGFSGATVSLVAKEAEVSRGLLHYYFKNKEEMLTKVIRGNMEASVVLIDAVFSGSSSVDEFAHGITSALRSVVEDDPHFFVVFLEGIAASRQSRMVRDQIASLYGQFRNAICMGLRRMKNKGIINPAAPLEGLACLLTGIIDGMGLQFVTEAELREDEEIWTTLQKGICLLLAGSPES